MGGSRSAGQPSAVCLVLRSSAWWDGRSRKPRVPKKTTHCGERESVSAGENPSPRERGRPEPRAGDGPEFPFAFLTPRRAPAAAPPPRAPRARRRRTRHHIPSASPIACPRPARPRGPAGRGAAPGAGCRRSLVFVDKYCTYTLRHNATNQSAGPSRPCTCDAWRCRAARASHVRYYVYEKIENQRLMVWKVIHAQQPARRRRRPLHSQGALLHGVEVRHDVRAVLLLLEAGEGHVGALDVLLRVSQVVEERLSTRKAKGVHTG
jgi:hypothetical protein